jgi:hypothetical protein
MTCTSGWKLLVGWKSSVQRSAVVQVLPKGTIK